MAITIDASERPLILVVFVGASTDDQFDAYLAELEHHLFTGEGFSAAILDATRSGETPPRQREKQALWMNKHAHDLKVRSAGSAFVISSRFVRGFLTSILWIAPIPTPHVVVETMPEARAWALDRLKERGVKLTGL